jgi:hypothetical protein
MGTLLRGKMLAALRDLHARESFAAFEDFADPQAFDQLMSKLAAKSWVVYAKKPFRRVDHVLKYLGRYTHRVGIANSRLVDVREDLVIFRTKNGKTVSVTPVEFLRRFVQHVLPDGFHKIRHYGLYAGARAAALLQARERLVPSTATCPDPIAVPWNETLVRLTGFDVDHCPQCGGAIEHRPVVAPNARPPPLVREVAA